MMTNSVVEKFESLVARVLRQNGFKDIEYEGADRPTFDFVANHDSGRWAIEAKFYRTARAQPSLLITAAERLQDSALEVADKGMLVVSCTVPVTLRKALEGKTGITLIDRSQLINMAVPEPELLGELTSLLEVDPDENQELTEFFRDGVFSRLDTSAPLSRERRIQHEPGAQLCQELEGTGKGKSHWREYEVVCEKIVKYLFQDELEGWRTQERTDDGLNRYDMICRIRPNTEFWRFLLNHLNSRYVLFEFKNYRGKISQGQILTTEKYLLSRALRQVAIIFTRKGAEINAVKMAQGAMREHGKLMIVLDDDIVCRLLEMKQNGEDPSDHLFQLADDFLLTLPR